MLVAIKYATDPLKAFSRSPTYKLVMTVAALQGVA